MNESVNKQAVSFCGDKVVRERERERLGGGGGGEKTSCMDVSTTHNHEYCIRLGPG